jgi:HAD superfamily hydrolase (TIGR01509 family)
MEISNMKYKAIIFDLDGVVIDTVKLWTKVNKLLLEKRGKVYDEEFLTPLVMSRPLLETVQIIKDHHGLMDDPIELLYERSELAKKVYEEEVGFIPGFLDFFHKAQTRNLAMAIATSSGTELIEVVDDKLGIRKLFNDNVYSISDVGNKVKPNPEIFLFAAKKIATEPKDTMTIVDSANSIEGSQAAGMYTIAITTTFPRWQLEDNAPNEIVTNFEQIKLEELT